MENTISAPSEQVDVFDMASVSAELPEVKEVTAALRQAEHVFGYRCLVLVTNRVSGKETSYPIGTMQDRESLLPRVKLYVEYREAQILDPKDKRFGQSLQVWPAHLRIVVDFVKGTRNTSSGSIQTEIKQSICFHLPAHNHEGLSNSVIDVFTRRYKNEADVTMADSSRQSMALALIQRCETQEEVNFIKGAVQKEQFSELFLETSCRRLYTACQFFPWAFRVRRVPRLREIR